MFHNQNNDIQSDLSHFNDELAYINLANHCVHASPIIRSEEEYKGMSLDELKKSNIMKLEKLKMMESLHN